MIDIGVWALNILLVVWAILLIHSSQKEGKSQNFDNGLMLFTAPLFISGMAMTIDHKSPWQYIVMSGTEADWEKAFFGGVMLLMLFFLLFTFYYF